MLIGTCGRIAAMPGLATGLPSFAHFRLERCFEGRFLAFTGSIPLGRPVNTTYLICFALTCSIAFAARGRLLVLDPHSLHHASIASCFANPLPANDASHISEAGDHAGHRIVGMNLI